MTSYRVIESKHPDDTDLPWEYEEAAFVSWVDEVFLEGYKHIKDSNHCSHCENGEDAPFLSPQEAIDLLEGNGYTVVTVIDVADIGKLSHEEAEKLISAGWTEGVMYRGLNIFDTVYNEPSFRGSIWEATKNFLPKSNQECYLGYIAKQDRFVVGFDTWPAEADCYDEEGDCENGCVCYSEPVVEGSASVLFFTLTKDGTIISVSPVPDMEPMFYANNWKKLKELYPSLYDIRLD